MKDKPKKKSFFKRMGIAIGILLVAIVVFIAGLVAFSFFNRTGITEHLAPQAVTYVSIPNIASLTQEVLSLKALDVLTESEEYADIRAMVRALRSNQLLQSSLFSKLMGIRGDVALYPDASVLAVADLGIRSSVLPLLPLARMVDSRVSNPIENMYWVEQEGRGFWQYRLDEHKTLYIGFYKNLLIIATTYERFLSAFREYSDAQILTRRALLNEPHHATVRMLTNFDFFAQEMAKNNPLLSELFQYLSFPTLSILDVTLKNESVSLSAAVPYHVHNQAVSSLLHTTSTIPRILNRLPASVSYCSVINSKDPQFLIEDIAPLVQPNIPQLYRKANSGVNFLFRKSIDELLFSWMAGEMGLYALENMEDPVFFIGLTDERACKETLNKIYNSVLVDRDISAIVDGVRMPRIVFPPWVEGLLSALDIRLPRPFYLIKDKFLYLSMSTDPLLLTEKELERGDLLVKTDKWTEIKKGISPESTVLLYYNLDRTIPFFLEGKGLFQSIFKLYRLGVASVRLSAKNTLHFELSAQKTPSKMLAEIAGYPLTVPKRPERNLIVGKTIDDVPVAVWTSENHAYYVDLSRGSLKTLSLDSTALIEAQEKNGRIAAFWLASVQGTVYYLNSAFTVMQPFPKLFGERLLPFATTLHDHLVVPLARSPQLLFVGPSGNAYRSDSLQREVNIPMAHSESFVLAVPRSFNSLAYVFDGQGKIQNSWPRELSGIVATKPLFISHDDEAGALIISEEGLLMYESLHHPEKNFTRELGSSVTTPAVFSQREKAFYLVTDNKVLWKINLNGEIENTLELKQFYGESVYLNLNSLNTHDILTLSGEGNSIYAYFANLSPISGFPLAGARFVGAVDIDGDGQQELVSIGLDNRMHCYALPF